MSKSSELCFLQKSAKKNATRKQNYFFLILVTGLVMVIVFIKIQCGMKDTNPVVKNDYDWLRDKNYLPPYVRPEADTAVFVPTNISAITERQFIACFVISAPKNRIRRKAIRQTWGKIMKPIFLIGRTDNETMSLVSQEARQFNDIIIEDFVDSYVNLTIKVAFAMKNFLKHFKDSKYFHKIDDDVFLNAESLFEFLKFVPKDALIGRLQFNSVPVKEKDNKWYVPKFLFDDKCFPPYMHGPSYMIPGLRINLNFNRKYFKFLFSGHLVESIYNTSMLDPFLTIEDVYYTGIIAGKTLNYTLFDTDKFRIYPLKYSYPCLFE